MKYQDSHLGTRAELGEFIKKAIPDLFAGRLVVEGKPVALPDGADFDYKVKYDDDEQGSSVTLKVSWDKDAVVDEISLDD